MQDSPGESLEEDMCFVGCSSNCLGKAMGVVCGFLLFRAARHFNHKITANLQKGKEILANLHFHFFFFFY